MIVLLLAVQYAHALVVNTALLTSTPSHHGLQHNLPPQTTVPPKAPELRVRQQSALATCGFIDGDGDKPVTCGTSLYCATTSTFIGCCQLSNCRDIFTTCYDLLGSSCDESCQNNPQNLVCPGSLPYCARYNYEGGSVGLGCAFVRGYTSTVLLTTKGPLPTLITNSSSSSPTSSTSPTSSPAPRPSSGGLSTGATAGIAIAATLGAVALAVLAWFFYRRSRKNKPVARNEKNTTAAPQADNRISTISEMGADTKSPITQGHQYSPVSQSPPHYSQQFVDQTFEMPDNQRPDSTTYAPTELGSSRN